METSMCCLSTSVGSTSNRWLVKHTGGLKACLGTHVVKLWHTGRKFFTCANTPGDTTICTSVCWSTSCLQDRFLTVLARLFDFFYVWRHKHGTELLCGVDDHTAEGVQTVRQADIDARQRNICGFFLPLWILLQNKTKGCSNTTTWIVLRPFFHTVLSWGVALRGT